MMNNNGGQFLTTESVMNFINVLSFIMSVANYGENLDQQKAQTLLENALEDIHQHLDEQDKKLDFIIDRLGGL